MSGSFSIVDASLVSWKAGGRELEAVPIVAGGVADTQVAQGGTRWDKVAFKHFLINKMAEEGGTRWHRSFGDKRIQVANRGSYSRN